MSPTFALGSTSIDAQAAARRCQRNVFGLEHLRGVGALEFCLTDARHKALLVRGEAVGARKEHADASDQRVAKSVAVAVGKQGNAAGQRRDAARLGGGQQPGVLHRAVRFRRVESLPRGHKRRVDVEPSRAIGVGSQQEVVSGSAAHAVGAWINVPIAVGVLDAE